MTKILFIVNGTQALYNHRLELIKALLAKEYKVDIISPWGREINPLIDLGCNFINVPIEGRGMNPFADLLLLNRYYQRIIKSKPDVILTFYTKSNIYGGIAASICNVPYITNITGLGSAVEKDGLLQHITVPLYKLAMRKASCIFFQNDANYQFFKKRNIKPEIGRRIPGSGVSLERFPLQPYPNDNTIEFLFVSRIMREKGMDQFLDAAKIIRKKYPFTRFHVVGNYYDDYSQIFAELEKEKIIIYHGQQLDIHPYIRQTHCTILPSYYPEGMSNVLLESAASGRPLITTDRAGCKETVEDDVTGFIIKQKDSQDLIDKIEKFLSLTNEERKTMGVKGREKMEKEFNRQIVINAYLEEIDKILSK
ncbi:MAG: glycosyltransferase family 4 protein [Phocaeicola sp.]|uniref:glycosyltransferase family 4 protein n=1 Tax=Phocaeicola TaxID=909656 RepID=UPI00234E4FD2|nr:glycosyltransferase family 4 protein [Phocaeicola oris]MCE2615611.1 glycosyltransferase family 4 protein [Phocaeicola oris]